MLCIWSSLFTVGTHQDTLRKLLFTRNSAEEIVRGDIDLESRQIVEENLNEDRKHIYQLNSLMETNEYE